VWSVGNATYNAAPDVEFPFTPKIVTIQNLNGADVVYASFDGVTDAAALVNNPLAPASQYQWRWQYGLKVWLQTAGAATVVQVIAEA
jgi:hypothetical protein